MHWGALTRDASRTAMYLKIGRVPFTAEPATADTCPGLLLELALTPVTVPLDNDPICNHNHHVIPTKYTAGSATFVLMCHCYKHATNLTC